MNPTSAQSHPTPQQPSSPRSTYPLRHTPRGTHLSNHFDNYREILGAAERTVSLVREQIRLHNEQIRLTNSFLEPTQRQIQRALERDFSRRDALRQYMRSMRERERWRQQAMEESIPFTRTAETRVTLGQDNLPINLPRMSSLLPEQQELNLNGCPIPTYSIITNDHTSYLVRESSDRWIGSRQRESMLAPSASRRQFSNQDDQRSSSGSNLRQQALEREWERQLADGEVDTNGVPVLKTRHKNHSSSPPQLTRNHSSPGFTSTHLGTRKVDGLGLQLAMVSNPECNNSLTAHSFHPLCLR